MKLYTHLDRIDKELEDAGLLLVSSSSSSSSIMPSSRMSASRLSPFDSMHYLGDSAVLQAMACAKIDSSGDDDCCSVLDIGSGLGGPARLLSEWTGCHVDALELQSDLHRKAIQLTQKCGLQDRVHHYCGDILSLSSDDSGGSGILPPNKQYSAIVSFLVFLHIPHRPALFETCWNRLQPGGRMFVEDYVRLNCTMTDRERQLLEQEVYVQHELPTWDELKEDLQAQGFVIVSCHDMTQPWRDFVRARHTEYAQNMERHQQLHGTESANALRTFYKAVDELFQGGRLGGRAYTVEKPLR